MMKERVPETNNKVAEWYKNETKLRIIFSYDYYVFKKNKFKILFIFMFCFFIIDGTVILFWISLFIISSSMFKCLDNCIRNIS